MSCWEILEINQTSDLGVIKTAYAAKAKEWHPEEHPEEFQQLQQAYRSAVRFAKNQSAQVVNPATAKIVVENRQSAIRYQDVVKESVEAEEEAAKEATEKPMIVEEIGELTQNYDYGELLQSFDYEEIEETNLKDQFFLEFFSIAWNPYLMNNLVCWTYILKRSPYELLLSKTAFRYNFVRSACLLSGWRRETLLFFEKWLQSHPAADADKEQKKETDLLCWRFEKIGLKAKLVPVQRCATIEQKALHDAFLSKVKRCGRDTDLTSEQDMECYLSFYLPYAAQKQSKMKEQYQKNNDGRLFVSMLLLMVPLILGMMIYVNAYVIPHRNERTAQEAAQQRIQQQADEIRKYNETEATDKEWSVKYKRCIKNDGR